MKENKGKKKVENTGERERKRESKTMTRAGEHTTRQGKGETGQGKAGEARKATRID